MSTVWVARAFCRPLSSSRFKLFLYPIIGYREGVFLFEKAHDSYREESPAAIRRGRARDEAGLK
jgi:hypothetical protein